jgi:hypothetical protein
VAGRRARLAAEAPHHKEDTVTYTKTYEIYDAWAETTWSERPDAFPALTTTRPW